MVVIESIQNHLTNIKENWSGRDSKQVVVKLAKVKAEAVAANEQAVAKEVWCLETILDIQDKYINAFELMKGHNYYDAWCVLEQVELALLRLHRHFRGSVDYYQLNFIYKHTEQFQFLFPYKVFASPEYLKIETRCGICDAIVMPRNPCGHRKGEIYDGEMCVYHVTQAQLLNISMVKSPSQRYSVVFTTNNQGGKEDQFDYSVLEYVLRGLDSPFHGWRYSHTVIEVPHQLYKEVRRDQDCPCGSESKYKHCCLKRAGVIRPHMEIQYDVKPDADMPEQMLLGYEGK